MTERLNSLYRALPPMNTLLDALAGAGAYVDARRAAECAVLFAGVPRALLRENTENFLNACRASIADGRVSDVESLSLPSLLPRLLEHISLRVRPSLRRVINATGIIIHTNLGRSRLAEEAVAAMIQAARHPCNLEFDLSKGERSSRHSHVAPLLCRLTGAESALVVNNNAAAILLVLDTLCANREVIVSRGELVEIGGNFRIPDVMQKSGCLLKEVGTTNCTRLADFEAAVTDETAAILKVHSSNFRIMGFTAEADRKELAGLAHSSGIPLIEDLGSGILFDFAAERFGALSGEPTVSQVLAAGVDVVTFSGDKALGGPQAGIILGKAEYIRRIAGNPLIRALRMDKFCLAALESTLRLFLESGLAETRIPTIRMMTITMDELRERARKLMRLLKNRLRGLETGWTVALRQGSSRVGGGAFPEHDLPSWLVVCAHPSDNLQNLRQALFNTEPAVASRVESDALCLDVRTVEETELPLLAQAIVRAIQTMDASRQT